MAKLLWIGDAGMPTGFSTVSHAIGERLVAMGHEVHVLAVGWDAKYPADTPMKLYRSEAGPARNYLGLDRTAELVQLVEPDVVILNEDAPMMLRRLFENRFDPDKRLLKGQPIIGYLPIDSYGIPAPWMQLKETITVLPYTQFGADAMGLDVWAHHGIEPVWRPFTREERMEARQRFGIEPDTFVIGRVDTNTGRKDWGSTWRVIDTAYQMGLDRTKTVALFHTTLNEPRSGINLEAVISRGRGKYMITNEKGWPVDQLVQLFNVFDIFLTTSRGEGWGLNPAQAIACGAPVVATDCSSLPEVVGPGGVLVPGLGYMTNPYGTDLVLADTDKMAEAVIDLANDEAKRFELARLGMEHITQFDWETPAGIFNEIIEGLVGQT